MALVTYRGPFGRLRDQGVTFPRGVAVEVGPEHAERLRKLAGPDRVIDVEDGRPAAIGDGTDSLPREAVAGNEHDRPTGEPGGVTEEDSNG